MSQFSNHKLHVNCNQCPSRNQSIFKDCDQECSNKIDAISNLKKFNKGDVLFSTNKSQDSIYCIRSGIVKMYKLTKNKKSEENCLYSLAGPGDILGFSTTANLHSYPITAIAMDDVQACLIKKETLNSVLENSPATTNNLLGYYSNQQDKNSNAICDLSIKSVQERVAQTLINLSKNFSRIDNGKSVLDLKLSREDYANLSGTVVETFVRTLSELKKLGILQVKAKSITILNQKELEKIAGQI